MEKDNSLGVQLGQGSYGEVRECQHKETRAKRALKLPINSSHMKIFALSDGRGIGDLPGDGADAGRRTLCSGTFRHRYIHHCKAEALVIKASCSVDWGFGISLEKA